jgi:hypothetical protein
MPVRYFDARHTLIKALKWMKVEETPVFYRVVQRQRVNLE